MTRRLVLYARGTNEEIERQQGACRATAEETGAVVVALASDPPGGRTGWADANALVDSGGADGILVATRSIIPGLIESVTGLIRGRRPKRIHRLDE